MEVDQDDSIIISRDKKRTKVDRVDNDDDDDDVSPPSNSPRMTDPHARLNLPLKSFVP